MLLDTAAVILHPTAWCCHLEESQQPLSVYSESVMVPAVMLITNKN